LAARRSGGERVVELCLAMLLVTLVCFSPAFGANWLLGARFRFVLPGACMALGVWLMTGGSRGFRWRLLVAAVLAQLALFSERTGVLVWIALAPLVFVEARRRQVARPVVPLILWCLAGNIGTALCFDESASYAMGKGVVGLLFELPHATLEFALRAAGSGVPNMVAGTTVDEVVVGGLLLVAFVVLASAAVRRRVIPAAMPWLALALFGLGQVVLLCEYYATSSLTPELLRELTWACVFLPVGLAGVFSCVVAHISRRVAVILLSPLLVVALVDWGRGLGQLDLVGRLLRQCEASLVFSDVGEQVLPEFPRPSVVRRTEVVELRDANRLRRPRAVSHLGVGQFTLAPRGGANGELTAVARNAASGWVERGRLIPDLVLLTRRRAGGDEQIFRIAAPVPLAGHDRWSWVAAWPANIEFAPGERVRAYGFDVAWRRVFVLRGEFSPVR